MTSVLSAKSIKTIEKGMREGKCLTIIPGKNGAAHVVQNDEFLSAEESEELLKSFPKPTHGDCLERFIWEFEYGSTKKFAEKVGYHPNRISTLKSSTHGISTRLFRCMVAAYKLNEKERDFWAKWLLDI